VVLVFATCFCALLAYQSHTTEDPFAKIVAAGLGGIIVVFITPYWTLYRGQAPAWLAILVIAAVDLSVMMINGKANEALNHAHWYNFWYISLFSIPGCYKLWSACLDARERSVLAETSSEKS
jgi:hypothetical protein